MATIVVCLMCLLLGMVPVAEAQPVAQFEVSASGVAPAMAYNSRNDEFVIVWSDVGPGGQPAVMGRRLDGDGQPLGRAFRIASTSGDPAVAYNSRRNEYLVVWAFEGVRGQRLNVRGSRLGGELTIGRETFNTERAAVAHSPVADRYLVAWVFVLGIHAFVHSRQLDAAGRPLRDVEEISSGCGVATAASEREASWLVAVAQLCALRDFPGRIVAARVSPEGVRPATEISREGIAHRGNGPGVAFNPSLAEYLMAWWADDRRGCGPGACPGGLGVRGQRLTAGGAQVGTDDFPIAPWDLAPATAWATDVASAFDPRARRYLVVWEGVVRDWPDDGAVEVLGQRLRGDGAEVGPDDFQISTMDLLGAHAGAPVVAGRGRRGGYLVGWQRETAPDGPATGIFARLVPGWGRSEGAAPPGDTSGPQPPAAFGPEAPTAPDALGH